MEPRGSAAYKYVYRYVFLSKKTEKMMKGSKFEIYIVSAQKSVIDFFLVLGVRVLTVLN